MSGKSKLRSAASIRNGSANASASGNGSARRVECGMCLSRIRAVPKRNRAWCGRSPESLESKSGTHRQHVGEVWVLSVEHPIVVASPQPARPRLDKELPRRAWQRALEITVRCSSVSVRRSATSAGLQRCQSIGAFDIDDRESRDFEAGRSWAGARAGGAAAGVAG